MGTGATAVASLWLAGALAAGSGPGPRAPEDADLEAIRRRGVLRHLGIPYAHFVTGPGEGLDADLVRAFAASLGVRYEFVETTWSAALGDLVGRRVSPGRPDPRDAPVTVVRGDVLAAGVTVLPWRTRSVLFSAPTFPTQVWIVALSGSPVAPIAATGDVLRDVREARRALVGKRVLGVPGTCIDPALHDVAGAGGRPVLLQTQRLDEVAPALLRGEGDLALLDVADADLAFERWPGLLKVIGPVTPVQDMAAAFRRDSPGLRKAFDEFLAAIRADGTYERLVARHFPHAAALYPDRFPRRP
jgi:ABC-type amino acid transport substrate-binding protein